MRKFSWGAGKLIIAILQLSAASFASVGIVYAGLNFFVLASSAPGSAAFVVGVSAITLSYLAFCFFYAAAISIGEGMSLFWNRET